MSRLLSLAGSAGVVIDGTAIYNVTSGSIVTTSSDAVVQYGLALVGGAGNVKGAHARVAPSTTTDQVALKIFELNGSGSSGVTKSQLGGTALSTTGSTANQTIGLTGVDGAPARMGSSDSFGTGQLITHVVEISSAAFIAGHTIQSIHVEID